MLQHLTHRAQPHEQRPGSEAIRTVIVIGASAGGRAAITTVLKELSHDIPAAVIVVLHTAPTSGFSLSKWFAQFGHIPIVEVTEQVFLREGAVFVAPAGNLIVVQDDGLKLERLRRGVSPPETIDNLFKSVVKIYAGRTIGVVLSGLLQDGSRGLQAVHQAGGVTVVQDPDDADFRDMPANALRHVPEATFRLKVEDIGPALDLLARRTGPLETGVSSAVRLLKERTALLVRLLEQSTNNQATAHYLRRELMSLRNDLRAVERLLPQS